MQAVKAYEGAVRVDEGRPGAALALAKLLLEQGQAEQGRAVCAALLQSQPSNLDAQLLMVQLLLAQVG